MAGPKGDQMGRAVRRAQKKVDALKAAIDDLVEKIDADRKKKKGTKK